MAFSTALVTESSQVAARSAIGAAMVATLALVLLHMVRRDLDPGWHVISEYAVGAHGWIMALCFAAFALASGSLFVALMGHAPTLMGKIGLAFLLAAAIGPGLAAIFPMDPISTARDAATFSGRMHGVSFMIGVPGQILAVLLLSLALRGQPFWGGAPLLLLTAVIWISLAVMGAGIVMSMKTGMDGPGILGWANRLFMIAYAGWVGTVAWPLAR
jgi:hypothetical protein